MPSNALHNFFKYAADSMIGQGNVLHIYCWSDCRSRKIYNYIVVLSKVINQSVWNLNRLAFLCQRKCVSRNLSVDKNAYCVSERPNR